MDNTDTMDYKKNTDSADFSENSLNKTNSKGIADFKENTDLADFTEETNYSLQDCANAINNTADSPLDFSDFSEDNINALNDSTDTLSDDADIISLKKQYNFFEEEDYPKSITENNSDTFYFKKNTDSADFSENSLNETNSEGIADFKENTNLADFTEETNYSMQDCANATNNTADSPLDFSDFSEDNTSDKSFLKTESVYSANNDLTDNGKNILPLLDPTLKETVFTDSSEKTDISDNTQTTTENTVFTSVSSVFTDSKNETNIPEFSVPVDTTHATLRIEHLKKRYGKREVVKDITFSMQGGDVIGLLGPNGAGKTTTFYMIVGFIKANGGNIYINEHNIMGMPMFKRARMGLSYLPQEPSIFRKLSVRDNVKLVAETRKDLTKIQKKELIDRLIQSFGLEHLIKQKGYTLSGGERRRTEIARSLATSPSFLLLDEPFAGIDPKAVYEIKQIIKRLSAQGIGILITDHNVRDTLAITTCSHLISDGSILVSGTKKDLLQNEIARTTYFGDAFEEV